MRAVCTCIPINYKIVILAQVAVLIENNLLFIFYTCKDCKCKFDLRRYRRHVAKNLCKRNDITVNNHTRTDGDSIISETNYTEDVISDNDSNNGDNENDNITVTNNEPINQYIPALSKY